MQSAAQTIVGRASEWSTSMGMGMGFGQSTNIGWKFNLHELNNLYNHYYIFIS